MTERVQHIERQIPPKAHTSMYNWHKYWARKTWNVVGAFIDAYSSPGAVVLDPFAGSGVVGIEALRLGRRAILSDIVPITAEIVWATLVDIPVDRITRGLARIENAVRAEIEDLYLTSCPVCATVQPSWGNVWDDGVLVALRYICTHCGTRHEQGVAAKPADHERVDAAARRSGDYWYPDALLLYPDGQPFLTAKGYRSIADVFTPRNLLAFAMLMKAIEDEHDAKLRRLFKVAFTSVVHLGTRMVGVMDPSPTNHHTAWSPIGWQLQAYWAPPRSFEKNVWQLFESAVVGHQGIVKAKRESASIFDRPVRFAKSVDSLLSGEADIFINTGDSRKFLADRLPAASADYIFTDPPYDASVQYGELAFLWVAWLRKDAGYLERIGSGEVVRNERQHKDAGVYRSMLRGSFEQMFRALKDDAYTTVTFHNPSLAVRKATIEAGMFAGYEFEKIHHQPLAVRSAKSMWDPFGSAQGDFYLRFHKPVHATIGITPTVVDDARFERTVVETTKEILAERGEPTPYTFIINKIDPVLARHGFFSSLTTGLDVKTVLKRHLGEEFELVRTAVGSTEGELWWFRDPSIIPHPEIPLSERVDEAVLRLLRAQGTIEFTDAWEAVSIQFPNSMTPDTTSIMDALKANARQTGKDRWMLKPEVADRENQHNEVIAALAGIGKAWGFGVWIGKKEQAASVGAGLTRRKLSELVSASLRPHAAEIADMKTAEQLDCVWIGPLGPVACFEVEATTSMTSGLMRGSNLTGRVRRYLVIPEEREGQLEAKRRSPLFEERWVGDAWRVLHFDHLLQYFGSLRKRTGKFDALEGSADSLSVRRPDSKQLRLGLGA